MSGAPYIAGDWGTSRLRLSHCSAAGEVLAVSEGPGAAAAGDFAAVIARLTAPWREPGQSFDVFLSGMAGSSFGWRETPYLPCPADPGDLAGAVLNFESADDRIHIAPGLSCENPCGAPDVMRGEEVQILGAMRAEPALASGARLICMPGTHTKWVALEEGRITRFLTAPSGEAFAALRRHTVLVQGDPDAAPPADETFKNAARRALNAGGADLLHLLFECRSRRLLDGFNETQSASWLAGLIVGRDVAGALALFGETGPVTLIGAPALTAQYALALDMAGREARTLDGGALALAGLRVLHDRLTEEARHDA